MSEYKKRKPIFKKIGEPRGSTVISSSVGGEIGNLLRACSVSEILK
jgi:hypothetical protein